MTCVGLIKIYPVQDILINHKTKAQFRRKEQSKPESNIKDINGELLLQKHPFSSKENNSVSLKTDGHTLVFSFNIVACCMKRGLNALHAGEHFFDS